MKTPVKYALVIALVAMALAPLAAAVDVTVTVVDKDDEPIEDAAVVITNSTGNETCSDTTDGDGEVACDGLESGEDYKIVVTHDDYQTISDDKSIDDYDNDWKELAVVMRPQTYDLTITVCSGGSGSTCGSTSDEVDDADITIVSLDQELLASDFDSYDKVVFPDKKTKYEAFEVDEDQSTTSTDAEGTATVEGLEFNTNYNITVEKSGYATTWAEFEYPDKADDAEVDIKMVEPGSATFTAMVYDQATNEPVEGATVTAKSLATNRDQEETTNSRGAATFEVSTPACYEITASKDGYGSDSTEECFENDDVVPSLPLFLVSENRGPSANAGSDQYVLAGADVTLDASASSDPNDDELTYEWSDSLGTAIPSVEKPTVKFTVAGDHVITLTVSDGQEEATDTVTVYVDTPQNCGDSFCSLAENATGTCPRDCPVCLDGIKGAGECVAGTSFYCPLDCGIKAEARLSNSTALVPGNTTTIEIVDPESGAPVLGAALTVTMPNGTVFTPDTLMGKAEVTFPTAGRYTLNITAPQYEASSIVVEVRGSGMDIGWLFWPVVIIVIALAAVRVLNEVRKRQGGRGYRATKFKRGRPSMS